MSENPGFADDGARYRLDSRIATGGMGEVWRGTDTVLGREVAVKLLKTEYADDPVFRSRFETEARHAAALHHPGIAAVFDVGERSASDGSEHPRPFLVMELVEGQPLSALIGAGRDLDPEAVRDLLAQVGDALGAAHRAGIVHRDVKPANLIVTPGGQVKVTDFGIARAADGVGITRTGAVMGTPQYLSPEQAEGKPATSASDVYALGVVAFECLTGRRPFDAESPVATALAHIRQPVPELPASVPRDLAGVVRRALAKSPGDRFSDGAAFAAALRDPGTVAVRTPAPPVVPVDDEPRTQVLAATPPAPVPTPATPATGTTAAQQRSNVAPVVAAVVLLVALAVVLTLLLVGGDDGEPTTAPTTTRTSASPTEAETETTTSEPPTETQTSTSEPPTSTAPATVPVRESDYLGRDIDEVEAQLRSMDLMVTRNEQANTDPGQDGKVTDLNPTGDLQPGQTVTVTYWGDAPIPTETPTETTSTPTETTAPATGGPPSLLPTP